jgi:adenine-specific DNA-methyltransferase
VFDTPKPVGLLQLLAHIGGNSDGFVLDLFAGSGSLAEAVLSLNTQDSGNRRYILVQLPEPLNPENKDQTFAADFCDEIKKPRNVAELTKERLRRTAKKIKEENPLFAGDFGFRVFRLGQSNFTTWDAGIEHDAKTLVRLLEFHVDHIRDDRTQDDLLYELLLKSGFPLTTPVEKLPLTGKTVFSVAGGALAICLEPELTLDLIRAIAGKKPERVVCLDEGFAGNDQLKVNAVQIFKTKGVTSFKTV